MNRSVILDFREGRVGFYLSCTLFMRSLSSSGLDWDVLLVEILGSNSLKLKKKMVVSIGI